MDVVWSPSQLGHTGTSFISFGRLAASPDVPERATAILSALQASGHSVVAPHDRGLAPLEEVHTRDYLEFLAEVYRMWEAAAGGPEALPNVHPRGRGARRPKTLVGLLGWHTGDMACAITANTWETVYAGAQSAAHAAALVADGGRLRAYALCRPPGHHAFADRAMGFCYLNNAAVAAAALRKVFQRVAVLDVDVHHANGTQDIFYDRADVFVASIHSDPSFYYPFFSGYPQERGVGAGEGFTFNRSYSFGSDDGPFLDALDDALDAVRRYGPEAIVLSLGVDASVHDPHGRHRVSDDGFVEMARRIATLQAPMTIVQEGGYLSPKLGALVSTILKELA